MKTRLCDVLVDLACLIENNAALLEDYSYDPGNLVYIGYSGLCHLLTDMRSDSDMSDYDYATLQYEVWGYCAESGSYITTAYRWKNKLRLNVVLDILGRKGNE